MEMAVAFGIGVVILFLGCGLWYMVKTKGAKE